MAYIALEDCVYRGLYRLHSRNLSVGVFDEKRKGFIGVRRKFDSEFLDTEYHWDTGPPHGTCQPLEFLDVLLPQEIVLIEFLGSFDDETQRPVAFERPLRDGGSGWYFTDTGEPSAAIRSHIKSNERLFDWLKGREP